MSYFIILHRVIIGLKEMFLFKKKNEKQQNRDKNKRMQNGVACKCITILI